MLWVGTCCSAEEALRLFARRRTAPLSKRNHALQGVDSPSQRRYVQYLQRIIYDGVDIYARAPVLLFGVSIFSVPLYQADRVVLSVIIEENGEVVFDSAKADGGIFCDLRECDGIDTTLEVQMPPLLLNGDVTVRIFQLDESITNSTGVTRLQGTQGHISHAGVQCFAPKQAPADAAF